MPHVEGPELEQLVHAELAKWYGIQAAFIRLWLADREVSDQVGAAVAAGDEPDDELDSEPF